MRFACRRSGHCCRRPGWVYFTAADVRAAAALLGLDPATFRNGLRRAGSHWVLEVREGEGCAFHLGDACALQGAKPLQCRAWPLWPEVVGSGESWRRAARGCPGIGTGPTVPPAEIEGWIARLREAGIPEGF